MTRMDTRVFPLAQESAFLRAPITRAMLSVMTKNAPPRPLDEATLSDFLAEHTFGVLATLKRDGRPHLTTVVYTWDPETREIRISTTEDRLKVKQIRNNPHVSLHVSSADNWSFAVAEGKAELSAVTVTSEDAPERRLDITLRAERLYGTALDVA